MARLNPIYEEIALFHHEMFYIEWPSISRTLEPMLKYIDPFAHLCRSCGFNLVPTESDSISEICDICDKNRYIPIYKIDEKFSLPQDLEPPDVIPLVYKADQSIMEITEDGLSFTAQLHYFGCADLVDFDDKLDEFLTIARASLKNHNNLEYFLKGGKLTPKEVKQWAALISAQNYDSNQEIWAARTINAIYMTKCKIYEGDTNQMLQAVNYLMNCRAMLIFENLLKNAVWCGYQVSKLRKALCLWENNQNNKDESFWQKLLTENELILSQLVPFPIVLIQENAYIGGELTGHINRKFVDFLIANELSENVLIVEIKTPLTKILQQLKRPDYRNNYNISRELIGSIVQISNYKNVFMRNYNDLIEKYPQKKFYSFSPQCLVIAGNLKSQLGEDDNKLKSFELFRNELKDIRIVTYDELFRKVEGLVRRLEGKMNSTSTKK